MPDDGYFEEGLEVFLNNPPVTEHVGAHEHNFIEIGYVMKGAILHRVNQVETVLREGDYYIINYHVVHEMDKYSAETPVLQNVLFKPGLIDRYLYTCTDFCELTGHYLIDSSFIPGREMIDRCVFRDKDGEIRSLIEKLKQEYQTRGSGFAGMIRSYIIQIIINAMRFLDEQNEMRPEKETDDKQINQVLRYIKKHYPQTISLEQMAGIAFMSPEYFCRKFRIKTGMTLTQYLQKTRIQEACRLLLNTEKGVDEISEQVGYKSVKHFRKLFRDCCAVTPTQYRERYRKHRLTSL